MDSVCVVRIIVAHSLSAILANNSSVTSEVCSSQLSVCLWFNAVSHHHTPSYCFKYRRSWSVLCAVCSFVNGEHTQCSLSLNVQSDSKASLWMNRISHLLCRIHLSACSLSLLSWCHFCRKINYCRFKVFRLNTKWTFASLVISNWSHKGSGWGQIFFLSWNIFGTDVSSLIEPRQSLHPHVSLHCICMQSLHI